MNEHMRMTLPERISGLGELAYNMWWSWHPEARNLFRRLDRLLWKNTAHNPVRLLTEIPYHQLVACAEDANYLTSYDTTMDEYRKDLFSNPTWFKTRYPEHGDKLMAYFSLEFALHNSLPLYAGGLGVLAGDYCKAASDLGIPLVGVGFMYPQGYFHQHISEDGWQTEVYEQLGYDKVAVSRVLDGEGKRLTISVPLDSVHIKVAAWVLNVGRVKLYLLDTNLDENPQSYRGLTARLYGGDRELRLLQELVIGIGGVRILRALGLKPAVWHANEGHTTFMLVERLREFIEADMTLDKALKSVAETSVFTTHTPLPAGNDTFAPDIIDKYFHAYWGQLGITREQFFDFGTSQQDRGTFNMTILGLKLAGYRNGVSKLHGDVCRRMWHDLWPEKPEAEVPIISITNGVHLPTWTAPQIQMLFRRFLGDDWEEHQAERERWDRINDIPDEVIWNIHRWLKLKLIGAILDRARDRWSRDHVAAIQPLAMGALLDPEVLTIGFSRRFTGYKRASLVFKNIERLKNILTNEMQPVQIIFAGKAHPQDEDGKRLIQQVYRYAKDSEFGGRVAFVEDYDMHMARDLVAGVDVWLNTPLTLMEASGTSGQKASANGAVNLSILDGWWFEGYNGDNGWAVDERGRIDSMDRDSVTADAIYGLLEDRVIPLYYDRDINGTPHDWVELMKESIRSNAPHFNTSRMAGEYVERCYLKALEYASANHLE
ncbi:MAG: alpha-glucan family phosphorylase [Dehalococcoidia bacterium]|nr:alpha-glucan family phosphorylase [Dehalococcoidia bacterium]